MTVIDKNVDLLEIANSFPVPIQAPEVRQLNGGNINRTFLIREAGDKSSAFLLQQLNTEVFTNPTAVMENIARVTEHVADRIAHSVSKADRRWSIPRVIRSHAGELTHVDPLGGTWRALTYLGSATCYDTVQSVGHARQAGVVMGHFHQMLSDLDGPVLHDTLPGFHITPGYLAHYDTVCLESDSSRMAAPGADLVAAFIDARRGGVGVLEDALASGVLRQRTIHGDPKIANMLIDNESRLGVGIIDLDTVKPGLLHYDFGDCVRSCCNPVGEETLKPESAVIDIERVEALTSGFLSQSSEALTEADRHYLYDAIRLLTLELVIRFFTDHLAGDVYFRTSAPGHNLRRALVQMHLCHSIEAQESAIRAIVDGQPG